MYTLRSYQREAVDSTLNYFKKKREPAVIVLPTGAGKSLVIAELARIARGRVLVLAHVKELVEQNHEKYESYALRAGIYSAGLHRKDDQNKVIFGSIQSVARAKESFFKDFTLLVIDECHRVSADREDNSQYAAVITALKKNNSRICILGLTATPYRLGLGWIYEVGHRGEIKSERERFFKRCIFELPLSFMIKNHYLTPPVKIDIPVTCYDFSELTERDRLYTSAEVEEILTRQKRLTPLIIKNIVDITRQYNRQGVMIFSSSVKHAEEILSYLPKGEAMMVIGDTQEDERNLIVEDFKKRKFKYLVNISVLTTGFDAPHVDMIAILRPTESVSLYQQIIGRGLRLSEGKEDCLILDYTGMGHDIYTPEIGEKRPSRDSVPVQVECPLCGHRNDFWGIVDSEGHLIEHFGRKCRGASFNEETLEYAPCGFLFRYKICHSCGEQNDVTARECRHCKSTLIDADSKLKQARLSKNAHILRPDTIEYSERIDKKGITFLQVKYYDYDAQYLSEIFYFDNKVALKKFKVNFLRSHLKRPELDFQIRNPEDVISLQDQLREPSFVIARKQEKNWRITEKIFSEEL